MSRLTSPEHTAATALLAGPTSLRRMDSDAASIASRHTLRTLPGSRSPGADSPSASAISLPLHSEGGDAISLRRHQRRVLLRTGAQLFALFVVCALALFLTLCVALPEIDPADKALLKLPRNFEQLKALNAVLQRYKTEHYARVMLCWVVLYMFLQAFSIPGSMYMSILAGAMWGVPLALPIVCASVATGATLCYFISKLLGEVLIVMPKWKARVDAWKVRMDQHSDNMLSYLIVIRMMPLPPHNIVNILAPHLGIRIGVFWLSTFFGIFAVSVIHTTVGEKLDQMSSSDDMGLLSVRNAILMAVVIGAAITPILVKRWTRAEPLEEPVLSSGRVRLEGEEGVRPRSTPRSGGAGRSLVGSTRGGAYSDSEEDDELPRVSLRNALSGYRDDLSAAPHPADAWRSELDAATPRISRHDQYATSALVRDDDDESLAPSSVDPDAALFEEREHQQQDVRPMGKAARVLGYVPGAKQATEGLGQRAGALWDSVRGAR